MLWVKFLFECCSTISDSLTHDKTVFLQICPQSAPVCCHPSCATLTPSPSRATPRPRSPRDADSPCQVRRCWSSWFIVPPHFRSPLHVTELTSGPATLALLTMDLDPSPGDRGTWAPDSGTVRDRHCHPTSPGHTSSGGGRYYDTDTELSFMFPPTPTNQYIPRTQKLNFTLKMPTKWHHFNFQSTSSTTIPATPKRQENRIRTAGRIYYSCSCFYYQTPHWMWFIKCEELLLCVVATTSVLRES